MVKIVTIGGGTGQPELLRGLVKYSQFDITAIVSVMDNGGSSGALREHYSVLPPGDIRRCLSALSLRGEEVYRWWDFRFSDGPFSGHTIGNIVLTGLTQEYGGIHRAIDVVSDLFQVRGRVLPVTDAPAHLIAKLDDGTEVRGEAAIDVPQHDATQHIAQLWLEPAIATTEQVRKALHEADVVVLSMGDVYTSILPNLLVRGVVESIAQSSAKVIAVCNRSTKNGETHNFSCNDIARVFRQYLSPARLHTLLVDSGDLPFPDQGQRVSRVPVDGGVTVVQRDLADSNNPQLLSGEKVAAVILELCASL